MECFRNEYNSEFITVTNNVYFTEVWCLGVGSAGKTQFCGLGYLSIYMLPSIYCILPLRDGIKKHWGGVGGNIFKSMWFHHLCLTVQCHCL